MINAGKGLLYFVKSSLTYEFSVSWFNSHFLSIISSNNANQF